jgi:hypothetical protein
MRMMHEKIPRVCCRRAGCLRVSGAFLTYYTLLWNLRVGFDGLFVVVVGAVLVCVCVCVCVVVLLLCDRCEVYEHHKT